MLARGRDWQMHQVDIEVESNKKTAMLLFFLVRYGQDKYEEMAQADRKLSQRKSQVPHKNLWLVSVGNHDFKL